VNAVDQMFGTRENGELDPLRYDCRVDEPQEVARCLPMAPLTLMGPYHAHSHSRDPGWASRSSINQPMKPTAPDRNDRQRFIASMSIL